MSRLNKIFLLFWLVTWRVEYYVPDTCTEARPAVDAWTGDTPAVYAVPAVACFKKIDKSMSAHFPSKESAMAFVNTKPEAGQSDFAGTKISNVAVEEIHE